MTWHTEVLPVSWIRASQDLAGRAIVDGFYLAGGTGLALHVGHRRSVDLDLFRQEEFSSEAITARLRELEGLETVEQSRGTVHFQLHGVKVRLLHYPYPLLYPTHAMPPMAVADPRDIACMKVVAIGDRGKKRDFVDLYTAAQLYGLGEIFAWFLTKYKAVAYGRPHILKALTYFEDAEDDPAPDMLVPLDWTSVKTFFTREVPRLL